MYWFLISWELVTWPEIFQLFLGWSEKVLFGSKSSIWDYYLGVEYVLIFCFLFFLIQFFFFKSQFYNLFLILITFY